MPTSFVINASKLRARELQKADLSCCTFADGLACAGAGKVVHEKGNSFVRCGNRQCTIGGAQQPTLINALEAASCTLKTSHVRTPPGSS